MANNIKVLANGTLKASPSPVLYSPGGTKSALITSVCLLNKSASSSSRVVTLYVALSSAPNDTCTIFKNPALAANIDVVLRDDLTLSAGDALTGTASVADDVHYVIYGLERD